MPTYGNKRSGHARQYSATAQQHSPLVQCAELQAALMGSTSVGQHQDVLLKLLQSCKQLHADVAQHCAGQLTAVLRAQRVEHAAVFASWLTRPAGLLQELEIQLSDKLSFTCVEPAIEALVGPCLTSSSTCRGCSASP
jgi:hypothetical protein